MEKKIESSHKLHPILVRQAVSALRTIFGQHKQADKVIEETLRSNKKAGSSDRAFIAETVYGVVRNYRFLSYVLGRSPVSEAEWWQMVGIWLTQKGISLPHWTEWALLSQHHIRAKVAEAAKIRPVRESIPDWLDEMGIQELGAKWEPTLAKLNEPAEVILRTNTLRTDRDSLQTALEKEGIPTEKLAGEVALKLPVRKNVFATDAFKAGFFEVQDFSSQQVAEFLAPEPGQRVVDACAGAGGKTLHLAALMQNKGRLIALDIHEYKLKSLQERTRRAGVHNFEARAIESTKTIKRLSDTADRLLLDVPCSGLGVLRRNPDTKWKLKPEFLDTIRQTQQEILQTYSPICKPGGRVVYATCSIFPSENSKQVEAFLGSSAGAEFSLLKENAIFPQENGYDGFYMALLERKKA